MKRLGLVLLTLAAAFAITPAAIADTWYYDITAVNFTADLTLVTSSSAPIQTITDVEGTFDITGNAPVTFGLTPTENAVTPSNPTPSDYSLTISSDGRFVFDNLLYTQNSGNEILDWGGFLVDISGYELNIFGGAFGGYIGTKSTLAPGNGFFYFSDNGTHRDDISIPGPLESLTFIPEPDSVLLLGTGILGLAWVLFRRAFKRSSAQA